MDSIELQDLAEIRENHRKRLTTLEKVAALKGIDAEPELVIEIEEIRIKIEEIDRSIAKHYFSQAKWTENFIDIDRGPVTPKELSDKLAAIGHYIAFVEGSIRKEIAGVYKMVSDNKEKDDNKRIKRQRMTDILFLAIILLLVIIVIYK